MAQTLLVNEQVESGSRFLRELANRMPIKAAFWLQAADSGRLELHVASDRFNSGATRDGYDDVVRITQAMNDPNFTSSHVRLIGTNDPLARAAAEIMDRYPGRIAPHYRDRQFANLSAEEVYIYPLPIEVGT